MASEGSPGRHPVPSGRGGLDSDGAPLGSRARRRATRARRAPHLKQPRPLRPPVVAVPRRAATVAKRAEALLLPLVVVVGALGVALPAPARAIDVGGAVDPTLAVLVLTAGLAVDVASVRRTKRHWARIVFVLVASSLVLPALAWALSHLVTGPSRDGVLAVGVAPSEVASLSLAAIAGGEVAGAAALLVGSVLVTVLAGGAVIATLSGSSAVHPDGLLVTLVLVVGLPLAVGITLRQVLASHGAVLDAGRLLGMVVLLALLWEVAGEVVLRASYLGVVAALVGFIAGAGALGWALTERVGRPARVGLLLPVAMRDFAVAAGIASTAFGARAVGPLGIYGLLVLVVGTVIARRSSSGQRERAPKGG